MDSRRLHVITDHRTERGLGGREIEGKGREGARRIRNRCRGGRGDLNQLSEDRVEMQGGGIKLRDQRGRNEGFGRGEGGGNGHERRWRRERVRGGGGVVAQRSGGGGGGGGGGG